MPSHIHQTCALLSAASTPPWQVFIDTHRGKYMLVCEKPVLAVKMHHNETPVVSV